MLVSFAVLVLTWASAAYLLALVVLHYTGSGDVRRHHLESASFIFVAMFAASVTIRPTARTSDPADRPFRQPLGAAAAMYLAGALLLYAPAFQTGLFADDFVLLEASRQGRWTVWTELFRPTIFAVWRILDSVSRDVGLMLHGFNILLHAGNATMTTALSWRAGLSTWSGLVAGLLFLAFPASVEPILWPAGMQDVLMASLVLGFVLLLTGSQVTSARTVAAVLLLIAACLTKESGVTGLVLAALMVIAVNAPRRAWIALGVAAAVVAGLLVVRLAIIPLPASYAAVPSRYTLKEVLVRPFATLVVPLRADEVASVPWLAIVSVATLVVALCLAGARWHRGSRRFHVVVLSALFVLASIGAVNAIFYVDDDLLGSRYLYLGVVGWSMLLATLHGELALRWRPVGVGWAVLTVAWWVPLAGAHVRIWSDTAVMREALLDSAATLRLPDCHDISVEGLPQVHQGVPLFVNGFPEAMRLRRTDARFHVVDSAVVSVDRCRLSWDGTEFVRR